MSIASITNNASGWLNVAPLSVDTNGLGTYSVTVDRLGLADGIYSAGIVIRSQNSGSITVTINMQVSSSAQQANAGPQYIELLDANTSALVDVLQIAPINGFYDYTFSNVLIGEYTIRSGSDLDNDSLICEVGESCGAYPFLGAVGSNVINVNGDSPIIINLDFETGF